MIHIFCALPCEAQPIIHFFKLKELKQFDLFRLYQSNDKTMSLTITGVGKINMAAAVAYQHACLETEVSDIWLNVGIAGHINIDIGEARLVNKITDEDSKLTYYPQIVFKPPCQGIDLITLAAPSNEYQSTLFDMEASAFYQMAIRLGTAELIHCLKFVSDNEDQNTSTINASKVKKMISGQIQLIEKLITCLTPLSNEIKAITSEPAPYSELIENWHFTQSERLQLSRLLRQWSMRLPDNDVMQSLTLVKSGKAVLQTLRESINNSEFVIHD